MPGPLPGGLPEGQQVDVQWERGRHGQDLGPASAWVPARVRQPGRGEHRRAAPQPGRAHLGCAPAPMRHLPGFRCMSSLILEGPSIFSGCVYCLFEQGSSESKAGLCQCGAFAGKLLQPPSRVVCRDAGRSLFAQCCPAHGVYIEQGRCLDSALRRCLAVSDQHCSAEYILRCLP